MFPRRFNVHKDQVLPTAGSQQQFVVNRLYLRPLHLILHIVQECIDHNGLFTIVLFHSGKAHTLTNRGAAIAVYLHIKKSHCLNLIAHFQDKLGICIKAVLRDLDLASDTFGFHCQTVHKGSKGVNILQIKPLPQLTTRIAVFMGKDLAGDIIITDIGCNNHVRLTVSQRLDISGHVLGIVVVITIHLAEVLPPSVLNTCIYRGAPTAVFL